jgi:FKBP-type peptidyl-prolyl cis-trans isomerase
MGEQKPTTENLDQKDEESIDITPDKDGGVLKIIKRAGAAEFGHPITGDKVSVHYVGKLTDGKQFDSSRDRGEYFQFNIGKGRNP